MPISRMFQDAQDASAAVDELARAGYTRHDIHLFTGGTSVDVLESSGIAPKRAQELASRLEQGGALVVFAPPLGGGVVATEILERPRPSNSDAPHTDYEAPPTDHEALRAREAAPLSAALGMEVLSRDPSPLSSLLKMPTLSRRQSPGSSSFGLPLLSNKAAPLSSRLGLRLLSREAAPLSARIRMKTLMGAAAPLSAKLGLKTLALDAAPLSSLLGVKVLTDRPERWSASPSTLSDDAAPLSRWLGLKVLLQDRTPRH